MVLRSGQQVTTVALRYGGGRVALLAGRTVTTGLAGPVVLAPRGVPAELEGPLGVGSTVGRAVVSVGGRPVGAVALRTDRAVAAASLGVRLRDFIGRPLTIGALAVLAGCSLLLALGRRRAVRNAPRR